jgi:DNA-directed RNA polymerase specialized sigma subunit
MLAAARELKRRGREVEKSQRKLLKDRDAAIRKAVKAGMPVADVGEAFGITQQRVSQILKGTR